jgi:hypothetical protein
MKQYEKFEDWWQELESFGFRSERCFDHIVHSANKEELRDNILLWVEAAFNTARLEKNENKETN